MSEEEKEAQRPLCSCHAMGASGWELHNRLCPCFAYGVWKKMQAVTEEKDEAKGDE